ncbi:hypothetical protein [Staphylospora marina]|uniref:hypothetical protein n=1 Tax=Staphylospora marina TaxID=2490858 RepID=UPI000F5B92B9|nr:hypothetical protein [Staphylospora marina]
MKVMAGRFAAVVMLSTLLAAMLGIVPVLLERSNTTGSGAELAVFGNEKFRQLTENNLPDFVMGQPSKLLVRNVRLNGDELEIRTDTGSLTREEAFREAYALIRYAFTVGGSLSKVRLEMKSSGISAGIRADRARLSDDPGMNNPMGLPHEQYLTEMFDVGPAFTE